MRKFRNNNRARLSHFPLHDVLLTVALLEFEGGEIVPLGRRRTRKYPTHGHRAVAQGRTNGRCGDRILSLEGTMKGQIGFLKTTVIGGVIFLIPLIIIVAILGKAFQIMMRVAEPLSALVPIDSVADIAVVNLIAVALIILACFVAGLAAKTVSASNTKGG